MEYQEKFRFLNYQVINRKNASELPEGERVFLKVNLLDKKNTPCGFMIFDSELIKKFKSTQFGSLAEILVAFELSYNNDRWNVKLTDFSVNSK